MNNEFGVEDLALALSFSRMQLYRKFKSILGSSANEFIRNYRIKKAASSNRNRFKCFKVLYDVGFLIAHISQNVLKRALICLPKNMQKNIE